MFEEFLLQPGLIHLNHAAVGPWPQRTAQAVSDFAQANLRRGSLDYPRWLEEERKLRQRLARLIDAPSPDDIALLKNTSEGLSVVAHGLNWDVGDNVVHPAQEFPSNRIVWESLEARFDVRARAVDLRVDDPEAALLAAMDARTRLLSVSAVQYADGLRLDLHRLGEACRQRGVLFCVDAIQQLGALPLDVQACHIDFLAADAHKWLLGPEGIAIFYCADRLREQLNLHQYGWHMVEDCGNFDAIDWTPARSARRFECGSPNMLGIHALSASLSLFEELGMESVAEALCRNVELLLELLRAAHFDIFTPQDAGRRAGIVSFGADGMDLPAVHAGLMQAGVFCALRGGGIRFSPHFHTPAAHLEQAVTIASRLRQGR